MRTGSRADAEDVAAEVFARFAKHQARVPEDATLKWLMRVTTNACIDHARTRRNHAPLEESGADLLAAPGVAQDEADAEVWAAMRRLSAREQTVIYLRAVEDLPFKDVAALLGIAEAAAKMRYRRAITALGRTLGGDGSGHVG
jgi:RNA polymerase sigma-70 factor (ECF subfamily)